MNASSESGEWASLISTGACSDCWAAGRPAMSFSSFLGEVAGLACQKTFPFRWTRSEQEEENVRDARTCEAPCRVFFRSKSLTHRTHPDKSSSQSTQPAPDGRFATSRLQRPPYVTIFFPAFPSSQIHRKAYNPPNEVLHETSTGTGTASRETNPDRV